MLRGVKKQMIEVMNTENEFFEKAILVVSDKYVECDRAKLNKKATEYVSSINPFSVTPVLTKEKSRDRVKILLGALKHLVFVGIGALIAYLIL